MIMSALVFAWAMPVVVAVQLWYWMTNYQNGVVNYGLTKLGVGDFIQHDWYATPTSALGVTTTLIVWGAIPFVAITVYAGLSQVPRDLVEAASVDGAGPVRVWRDVTFPVLKPILLVLTSLSIIWDFAVFTQPFLLLQSRPNTDYYLMSIYLFEKSIGIHEYGLGSAIALVMVLIMLVLSFFYIRQMVRLGEVR
jgi:N,N'-diacetylchitobiose transport system permease protein